MNEWTRKMLMMYDVKKFHCQFEHNCQFIKDNKG
jgi:hypothetical protein